MIFRIKNNKTILLKIKSNIIHVLLWVRLKTVIPYINVIFSTDPLLKCAYLFWHIKNIVST